MSEEKKVRRCDNIAGKWMPDGSIRFYQMNECKGGYRNLSTDTKTGLCLAS